MSNKGRGGIAHRTACHLLARVGAKRGHKTLIEKLIPGTNHPGDAIWIVAGVWVVFEVVITCYQNIPSSLRACFSSPSVAKAIVVAPTQTTLKRIEQLIDADLTLLEHRARIELHPLEPYVKELYGT